MNYFIYTSQQNIFGQSLPLKHLKSDFSTVTWLGESGEMHEVYSTEVLLNKAMIRAKLDLNWLKFYGERNTGFHAITASQLQKFKQTVRTSKHLIEFTYSDFPCFFLSKQR